MDKLVFESFNYKKNLAEQRELFKDSFPETNGDSIQGEDHYMWKFHSFPAKNVCSWEYACYLDNKMVGYYAAIPYVYKLGERTTSVGMVCDVMTSSHHRGKGVFTKLGRFSTGELSHSVPITMGYPIRRAVIPGHLKVGWKIAFELPLYMRIIGSNSLMASKGLGFLSLLVNPLLYLYNKALLMPKKIKYYCKTYSNVQDVDGYSELVTTWMSEVDNALDKNLAFTKWRYSAPQRKYEFVGVYNDSNTLVGYAACRYVIKEEVPTLCILDFMILKSYQDCIGAAMTAIDNLAKNMGAEIIMTMMSRYSALNYKLIRNGFIRSPFKFYLIIKNLDNSLTEDVLYDEKKWHLMWVDSDDL